MNGKQHLVLVFSLVSLAACFSPLAMTSPTLASQGDVQQNQHDAFARSSGYPTRKSRADLDAMAQHMTEKYQLVNTSTGTLEALAPIAINGKRGMCYAVVLRLADGAAWDTGAEAGMLFDYRVPGGASKAGPGLVGPGAVGALPCADADGPITMRLTAMDGNPRGAPIGHGPYSVELWSHRQTAQEAASVVQHQQEDDERFRKYEAEENAKKQQRAQTGCSKCEARYQGCVGAGRSTSSCGDDYRSCAFEAVGPDYMSSCPNP